jgi:hypothetical protein
MGLLLGEPLGPALGRNCCSRLLSASEHCSEPQYNALAGGTGLTRLALGPALSATDCITRQADTR